MVFDVVKNLKSSELISNCVKPLSGWLKFFFKDMFPTYTQSLSPAQSKTDLSGLKWQGRFSILWIHVYDLVSSKELTKQKIKVKTFRFAHARLSSHSYVSL